MGHINLRFPNAQSKRMDIYRFERNPETMRRTSKTNRKQEQPRTGKKIILLSTPHHQTNRRPKIRSACQSRTQNHGTRNRPNKKPTPTTQRSRTKFSEKSARRFIYEHLNPRYTGCMGKLQQLSKILVGLTMLGWRDMNEEG